MKNTSGLRSRKNRRELGRWRWSVTWGGRSGHGLRILREMEIRRRAAGRRMDVLVGTGGLGYSHDLEVLRERIHGGKFGRRRTWPGGVPAVDRDSVGDREAHSIGQGRN